MPARRRDGISSRPRSISGLRISELLGLIWEDIDFAAGLIRVQGAALPRPPRRAGAAGAPKTPASVREVPLVEQLSHQLAAHKQASPFAAPERLGLRDLARHPIWPAQRRPARAQAGRPMPPA